MAEARKVYPAEPIQDILDCSICMERYNTSSRLPKQLPCMHTYCLQCLQSLDGSDSRGKVKCPECRLFHDVPSGGHFVNNFTIMRLLDVRPVAQQSTKASLHASHHPKTPTSPEITEEEEIQIAMAFSLSLSNQKKSPPDETRVVRLAGLNINSQTMYDFKIENGKVTKTNTAPLPEGIRIYEGSGRVQIGEELFLFGGGHKDGRGKVVRHNDVYKHNVGRMQWSKLKAMLSVVCNAAAFSLDNQTIYLAGGVDSHHVLATVRVYNTIRDTHTTLSDLPIAVVGSAAVVYNGTAYLSGGYCGSNGTSRDIYQYNKEQDNWTKVGTMKRARSHHALVEDQGLLYNVGGRFGAEQTPVLSIESFNPVTKQSSLLSTSLPGELIPRGWRDYIEGFLYFQVYKQGLLYRLELSTGKMTALHGDTAVFDYLMTV